jgi:hypothetical protein
MSHFKTRLPLKFSSSFTWRPPLTFFVLERQPVTVTPSRHSHLSFFLRLHPRPLPLVPINASLARIISQSLSLALSSLSLADSYPILRSLTTISATLFISPNQVHVVSPSPWQSSQPIAFLSDKRQTLQLNEKKSLYALLDLFGTGWINYLFPFSLLDRARNRSELSELRGKKKKESIS